MLRPSFLFSVLREPDAGTGNAGAPATAEPPKPPTPPSPQPTPPVKTVHEADIRAKVFAELGVKDPAEVKAALEAQRKATEAAKTDAEKAAKAASDLEATQKQLEAATATLRAQAATALQGLTETQRAAVVEVAGDDPSAQLRALSVLSATWAPAQAPAPAGVPAQTAPPTKNPNPAAPPAPADKREQYLDTRKRDPFLAAYLLDAHPRALG